MIMLQLALCLMLSLSNVCLGSDYKKMIPQIWEIGHISPYNECYSGNPYNHVKPLSSGKLQIYYAAKDNDDNYQPTARFMPNDNENKLIKFSNFDNDRYQEVKELESRLSQRSGEFDLSTPFYILRGGDEQWGKTAQVVEIEKIEKFYEPEELLDIQDKVEIVLDSNNVILKSLQSSADRSFYHPANIEKIRDILSLKKNKDNSPIKIIFKADNNENAYAKAMSYRHGSYIEWRGWIPSLSLFVVNVSWDLEIDRPKEVIIDLDLEKEELHHYSRNKWMSRGLMAVFFIALAYQLKDKIYNIGNALLQ